MPHFVVYALDKPGREKARLENRPAHRSRLREPVFRSPSVSADRYLMTAAG
jgi:hypothetical protein